MLKNYKLTSLKTLISCAAPLSAGVQQMLYKKYNSGGRAVHIAQGMHYAIPDATLVSDVDDHNPYHRVRHD